MGLLGLGLILFIGIHLLPSLSGPRLRLIERLGRALQGPILHRLPSRFRAYRHRHEPGRIPTLVATGDLG